MVFAWLRTDYTDDHRHVKKMFSFIHLHVVWAEDDPATEAVTQIDDGYTAAEPNHIGERCSKCDDEDLQCRSHGGRANYNGRRSRDSNH